MTERYKEIDLGRQGVLERYSGSPGEVLWEIAGDCKDRQAISERHLETERDLRRQVGLERYSGRQQETGKDREVPSERHWQTKGNLGR